MNSISKLLRLIVFVALTGMSSAGATTYVVNDALVTGTIVTDGTIGVLSNVNFTDWNLTDTNRAQQFTGPLSGSNSFVSASGNYITATASGIYFDFSQTDLSFLYFQHSVGVPFFICFNNAGNSCNGPVGPIFESTINNGSVFVAEIGNTLIADATPLPAALPLFATGLGALGLLGWRRKRKNAAA